MMRLFCDMDGVLVDFEKGIQDLTKSPSTNESSLWVEIKKKKDFWQKLEKTEHADVIWSSIVDFSPIMLSGVVQGDEMASKMGKVEWMKIHYNHDNVLVTDSKIKHEFLYPGDILIDDKIENITRWEERGGIGIHYVGDIDKFKTDLKNLISFENNEVLFTSSMWEKYEELQKNHRREGYSGYEISNSDRKMLVHKFKDVFSNITNNEYNTVCHHVTRCMPALKDIPKNAFSIISILGVFKNDTMGVQTLVCSVDGEMKRPDGGIYHITLALDNCESSIAKLGLEPRARHSNDLIAKVIEESGDEALHNLDMKVEFQAGYRLFLPEKMKKKEKPIESRTRTIEPYVFSDGKNGFLETKAFKQRISYKYYYIEDDKTIIHNSDGPAILTTEDGRVVFEQNIKNGKPVEKKHKNNGPAI